MAGDKLDESLRHDLAHMDWAVSHATPENPEVSFDYTLVANVLGYIKRLRANQKSK